MLNPNALINAKANLRVQGKERPSGYNTLVTEALQQYIPNDAPIEGIRSVGNIVRSTNYKRQKRRPRQPTDLTFQ
jgi:hypothetical protein